MIGVKLIMHDTKNPLVSVCIPMYNAEKYIKKTIDSIIKQTYTNLEIIVIDNASTDHSVNIVEEIQDPRIVVKKNATNVGLVNNWNLCIDSANGLYVNIVCADDILEEHCIEKKVEILSQDSKVGAVFSASRIINTRDDIVLRRRPFKGNIKFEGNILAKKAFTVKNCFAEPSNVLFRREVMKQVGYYDSNIISVLDWDYMLRVCLCSNVYYIDEYLTCFRISNTSTTGQIFNNLHRLIDEDKFFVEKYKKIFPKRIINCHIVLVRSRMILKIIFMKMRKL